MSEATVSCISEFVLDITNSTTIGNEVGSGFTGIIDNAFVFAAVLSHTELDFIHQSATPPLHPVAGASGYSLSLHRDDKQYGQVSSRWSLLSTQVVSLGLTFYHYHLATVHHSNLVPIGRSKHCTVHPS